uniref:Uncharacterized protein n=1 Tax=viral metagenome TaxID=1070528 RepID=A0A6H2A3N9_9ZZZZ
MKWVKSKQHPKQFFAMGEKYAYSYAKLDNGTFLIIRTPNKKVSVSFEVKNTKTAKQICELLEC